MARHDSNSDLGRLAATLTPRVSRPPAPPRASQSSGMFNVSALYAQVASQNVSLTYPAPSSPTRPTQVARPDARPVSVAPVQAVLPAPVARPGRPSWPRVMGWPEPISYGDHEVRIVEIDEPLASGIAIERIDLESDRDAPFQRIASPARSLGLGWYGVAVAWLATVTLGGIMATSLPAHALPRARTVTPAILATSLVVAPAMVAVAPTVSSLAPAAVLAAPLGAAVGPTIPEVSLSRLPIAPSASTPLDQATPAPVKRGVTLRAPSPAQPHPHARTSEAVASPRPLPPPSPPQAVATPSKPASTAGMSLDDLIRHEVQAESGKHR